jgi:rSAM/selenodomain-associated transferase 1
MKKHTEKLIVFTKYPVASGVKTRLIPLLGAAGAANLHHRMVIHMLNTVQRFKQGHPLDYDIYFTGGNVRSMKQLFGQRHIYVRQKGIDLGERMLNSFRKSFSSGFDKVVIIGTDSPDLDVQHLDESFKILDQHDLVIGPCFDGGYYLIGLRKHVEIKQIEPLFTDLIWGSDSVYETTIKRAEKIGVSIKALPYLHDVDRPEDVEIWKSLKLHH